MKVISLPLLAVASVSAIESPTSTPTERKKPNIIVMLGDDVGTGDLPFYWKGENTSLVSMPHLHNLAKAGVLFEDAHSTPLCAPSRYMLLSGNYPHRGNGEFGTWGFDGDRSQFKMDQKSIAQVLSEEAGYNTGVFGKWHVGAKVPPHGIKNKTHHITDVRHNWTEPLIQGPIDIGFDQSFISMGGIQDPPYNFFRNDLIDFDSKDAQWWEKGSHQMPYGTSIILDSAAGEGDPGWDASAYDMILVNETKDFIERHLDESAEKPFFAYVAFGSVHMPHAPPTEYIDGTAVEGRYLSHHLDMLGLMDKAVGSLMEIIKEKGLIEDTIVVYTSDNGGLTYSEEYGHRTSGPLRGEKSSIYDGGHRVPLLISQPGTFPEGKRRRKVVGLNDLYATICELVGISKPPSPSAEDSISFARYIQSGNGQEVQRESLGKFRLGGGGFWSHALRRGKWKFVHVPNTNDMELYDMKNDIGETNNLLSGQPTKGIKEKAVEMCKELREIGPCPLDGSTTSKEECKTSGFKYDETFCDVAPSSCRDSILEVAGTGGLGCGFIANNQQGCDLDGALSHCPLSCNSCDEFRCVDSAVSFVPVTGSSIETCDDLASHWAGVEGYCMNEEFYSTCRGTCNACN